MRAAKRLFVISDLHLGGDYPDSLDATGRGFRICTHVQELAAFVQAVAASAIRDRIDTELVINGDMVDFLAEKSEVPDDASGGQNLGWQPFIGDPSQARRVFQRIVDRDRIFFLTLKDLLAANVRLTILLGNHDIELSFPALRRLLSSELDAEGKRFTFIYDGEAYQVGDVLIEHGNRYDEWNVVTHDTLRRMRSVQSRMEPDLDLLRGFEAPAGSYLVAAVMNEIKNRFPFIDLLKPESEAAIPILIALAPEYRARIVTVAGLIARSRKHVVGSDGLPSYSGDIAVQTESPVMPGGEAIIRDILNAKLGSQKERVEALTPNASVDKNQYLLGDIQDGNVRPLWSILKLLFSRPSAPVSDRLPALLTALEGVRADFSFDRKREAEPYLSAAQRLSSRGFRAVLFGHTHLPKEMSLAGSTYINTGTWADILPFPMTVLEDPGALGSSAGGEGAKLARLGEFVNDMTTANLRKYLRFVPTYARIEFDARGDMIAARLCEYRTGAEL